MFWFFLELEVFLTAEDGAEGHRGRGVWMWDGCKITKCVGRLPSRGAGCSVDVFGAQLQNINIHGYM